MTEMLDQAESPTEASLACPEPPLAGMARLAPGKPLCTNNLSILCHDVSITSNINAPLCTVLTTRRLSTGDVNVTNGGIMTTRHFTPAPN